MITGPIFMKIFDDQVELTDKDGEKVSFRHLTDDNIDELAEGGEVRSVRAIRVLAACEFSGTVGEAFHKRGCNVLTCDLLPTEKPEIPHHQGDVVELLDHGWDLLIAHPPCTYLSNASSRHLYVNETIKLLNGRKQYVVKYDAHGYPIKDPERWDHMVDARYFFYEFLTANVPHVCVENPIPHKHARLPKYSQTVQPWQFGHGETKRTCLWLKNLPPLTPTNIVEGREARVHKMPPGPNRQKERSRFFSGIAEAMADQWIPHIEARL